jgi:hypothetical protein
MKNITSKMISVFALIFSTPLWAQTVIPVGSFQFKNNVDLVTVKKTEMVFSAERLKILKTLGWTCQQSLGQNKCWLFLKNQTLPMDALTSLQQKYTGQVMNFAKDYTDEVISDAPYLQEHLITQQTLVNSIHISTYILQNLKQGPTKLQLSLEAGSKMYLNFLGGDLLTIQDTVTQTEGNQTTLYLVQILLEKVQ